MQTNGGKNAFGILFGHSYAIATGFVLSTDVNHQNTFFERTLCNIVCIKIECFKLHMAMSIYDDRIHNFNLFLSYLKKYPDSNKKTGGDAPPLPRLHVQSPASPSSKGFKASPFGSNSSRRIVISRGALMPRRTRLPSICTTSTIILPLITILSPTLRDRASILLSSYRGLFPNSPSPFWTLKKEHGKGLNK